MFIFQVVIVGKLLTNIIDVLKVFSKINCNNHETESIVNIEDNKIYLPCKYFIYSLY